jgi:hypothetical protein
MCPMPGIALTHEVVERSRDAHDLVNGPGTGFDHDDEELAGHAGPPRLRRDRSETKAPRRIQRKQQDAELIRQEPRATGPIQLQPVMQFFEPVLHSGHELVQQCSSILEVGPADPVYHVQPPGPPLGL